jgi:hypothetical protein
MKKVRWADIVANFADMTYTQVVADVNECFPDWNSPLISELVIYLYTYGAYVKYLNTILQSPYTVSIDPSCTIVLYESGDTVAEGYNREQFIDDCRTQMGARFMTRYDNLTY